ncbi:MAG TPA: transposase [Candidatus Sulfotelmatobacter sp.]|nr:transposase [Candidatus Sulfotelmatobacter sp.]
MITAGVHGSKHKTINHSTNVYVDGDTHTSTVESAFSLLKRGIMGTWHKISAKHLAAYLEEMTFRFNRRKRSDLFLHILTVHFSHLRTHSGDPSPGGFCSFIGSPPPAHLFSLLV